MWCLRDKGLIRRFRLIGRLPCAARWSIRQGMRPKSLIPILLLTLAARSSAFNEEVTRTGDELITNLQQEVKELAGADGDNQQAASLRQYIRQVQSALDQENGRALGQYLDNFGNYQPSEKVEKGVKAIKKAVKKESDENTLAAIAEMQGILDDALDKVSRAAEPEELDKLIVALSRNRNNRSGNETYDSNDATLRSLTQEIANARLFVTNWQDYLQASNSGNHTLAQQKLDSLAGQENSLIPRSRIIARRDFEKSKAMEDNGLAKKTEGAGQAIHGEITRIVGNIGSLEEMKAALAELVAMRRNSDSSINNNPELKAAVLSLDQLDTTYREFLAGLPINLDILPKPNDSYDPFSTPNFSRQRADLLLLALPRCLDLPENFKATKDEGVDGFLKRAMADATGRGDTATARRIQATRQLFIRASTLGRNDVEALDDYAAGKAQLGAGQYQLAVISFQKALASGSDLIPAATTGEMLASIKKDHPKEFDEGVSAFLNPPPTPEFDRMRMRGYPGPQMGRDPRTSGGTTVVLPVPPKDPAPLPPTLLQRPPPATEGPTDR